jgi:tetratricopeptide (TPR) repeat protein
MDVDYLYDSWLDKVSWLIVFGFSGLIVYMISTRVVETRGQSVLHSPQARLELKYVPRRSPEVEKAIKQCAVFYKDGKADDLIALGKKIIAVNSRESFGYMYLARGYKLKNDYSAALTNYRKAVELNPDFVDKKSPDKIGKTDLIPLVQKAIFLSRKPAFKKIANYKTTMKNLYFMQRRLAGGCE